MRPRTRRKAVNDITLKLGRRKALGLVGETGAGKTTTALSILRLIPSPPGVVKSGQDPGRRQDVMSMNLVQLEAMRATMFSMVFQDPDDTSLNPVLYGGQANRRHHPACTRRFRRPIPTSGPERCWNCWVSEDRAKEFPTSFSGG
jgi:peptide/nickel transport system ATP-binding protein